jgi:hypothetical protein
LATTEWNDDLDEKLGYKAMLGPAIEKGAEICIHTQNFIIG